MTRGSNHHIVLKYFSTHIVCSIRVYLVHVLLVLKSSNWGFGRDLACFVELHKSKTPGLNPRGRQLKVESGAVHSVTGTCGFGQCTESHGRVREYVRRTHKV
eukprot:15359730-Ditylum_brightwellii.AAC.1